ncbi:MAG: hypothetical protein IKU72_05360 [Oscillospiraceae bacterium]|nr:hypothetical protein [Oscillospiraceae bacterium]
MKRVHSACLEQTIHFQLKEDEIGHEAALRSVANEVAQYKAMLERKHIKHKILDETTQPDGSIMVKIKRQYNSYNLGDYLE